MSRTTPIRSCVGCRAKAAKSDLLRVVVDVSGPQRSVVPDERADKPGRGAHLHPTATCLELADRRRAFPRAFRLEGPLDINAVRDWLGAHRPVSPETAPTDTSRKRSSGS
ncbi:MAG: YlxR family protein [Nocardioidaceae bacterium]